MEAIVGAVVAVVAAPILLKLLGFRAAGIAAGSIGAFMMSIFASLGGGGVAAGSLVATLQSVGAAGLGAVGSFVVGSVGAVAGVVARAIFG